MLIKREWKIGTGVFIREHSVKLSRIIIADNPYSPFSDPQSPIIMEK